MMEWIKIEDKNPKPCEDILFTDGETVFKGWLETLQPDEDLVFFNDKHGGLSTEYWPQDITHWMPLPELPKKETDVPAL